MLGAIGCARQSVEIVTPYFLPEQPMITALNVAAMRGVAVHIILPEQGQPGPGAVGLHGPALAGAAARLPRVALAAAVRPHQADGRRWRLVAASARPTGTPRSLRLNFEFNVECYDRDLAGAARGHRARQAGPGPRDHRWPTSMAARSGCASATASAGWHCRTFRTVADAASVGPMLTAGLHRNRSSAAAPDLLGCPQQAAPMDSRCWQHLPTRESYAWTARNFATRLWI